MDASEAGLRTKRIRIPSRHWKFQVCSQPILKRKTPTNVQSPTVIDPSNVVSPHIVKRDYSRILRNRPSAHNNPPSPSSRSSSALRQKRLPSLKKTPPVVRKTSVTKNASSVAKKRSSLAVRKMSPTVSRSSPIMKRASAIIKKTFPVRKRRLATVNQAVPVAKQGGPVLRKRLSVVKKRSTRIASKKGSPPVARKGMAQIVNKASSSSRKPSTLASAASLVVNTRSSTVEKPSPRRAKASPAVGRGGAQMKTNAVVAPKNPPKKAIVKRSPKKQKPVQQTSRRVRYSLPEDEDCPLIQKRLPAGRVICAPTLRSQKRIHSSFPSLQTTPPALRLPSLPLDVLEIIFGNLEPVPNLCNALQVCTSWKEAALIPKLWSTVTASDAATRKAREEAAQRNYHQIHYSDNSTDKSLRKSPKRRKRQRLFGVSHAVDCITRRAGKYLRSLDLKDCFPSHAIESFQMRDRDLENISAQCASSLEELRISPSEFITADALVSFAQQCTGLRVFHMTGCRTLTSNHLGLIVRSCPRLEDISVNRCVRFRGQSLEEKLHPIRKTLKRLDISDTITVNFAMRKFMFSFPVLEEIKMDNCNYISIDGQAPNMENEKRSLFPSLTSLNIDKIRTVPLSWLLAIFKTCPTLQILSANMIPEPTLSISNLFRGPMPNLNHLSLSGHPLDDAAWQNIYEKLGKSLVQCDMSRNTGLTCVLQEKVSARFAVLEQLNISGTGATDETVMDVIRLSPKLTFLDTDGCRSVENRKFRRDPLAFRDAIVDQWNSVFGPP